MSLKHEIHYFYKTHIMHFRYGAWHRLDNPAVIWYDGSLGWMQYGVSHRIGGPAHVRSHMAIIWCLRGITQNVETQKSNYTRFNI